MNVEDLEPLIRERLEAEEDSRLSEYAARSSHSMGRERAEDPCVMRTAFMRDRDRIIHTKAFRRLKHKTQVFLAPQGDHYRTRLTHTLEVMQISRTIARCLSLNEDLTEAIALGHDLGHTPFGHIGEDALTSTGRLPAPFNHNEQSVRVVQVLEGSGKGLNLSREVVDGILNHTGADMPRTLEGQIVRTADRIAYVSHDIDDAVRAGVLDPEDLPMASMQLFGNNPRKRINAMVQDMIAASMDQPEIKMSEDGWNSLLELRSYLHEKVYTGSTAKSENHKAIHVLTALFEYYFENPGDLPKEFISADSSLKWQGVTDYIAGMTDQFALAQYERLFLPSAWNS